MPLIRSALWSDPTVKPPFGAAEIDWGHPLAAGLRGYWPHNEGGGVTLADLANRGDGALVAAPPWNATARELAVTLNGTSQYATTPARDAMNISGPITLVARVRPSAVTNAHVIGGYQASSPFAGYALALGILVSGRISYWFGGGGWVESTGSISANVWSDIAATTPSSSTTSFYINGVFDSTASAAGFPSAFAGARSLYGRADGNNPMGGDGTLISVYGRLLMASEIAWVTAEPYAMLRPIVRRRYFVPAAAAADDIGASYHLVGAGGREVYGQGPVRSR